MANTIELLVSRLSLGKGLRSRNGRGSYRHKLGAFLIDMKPSHIRAPRVSWTVQMPKALTSNI